MASKDNPDALEMPLHYVWQEQIVIPAFSTPDAPTVMIRLTLAQVQAFWGHRMIALRMADDVRPWALQHGLVNKTTARQQADQALQELRTPPPLSFNPPPFPGDDTVELRCKDCGAPYTMRQYRVFAWVEHSDYCISCGSDRVMKELEDMVRGYDATTKEG